MSWPETIDEIVARAPQMTEDQAQQMRRLFRYIDPDDPAQRLARLTAAPRSAADDGVIYYAERRGLIKIGTSVMVHGRIRTLKAKLLATEPGSYQLEAERHRQFAGSRTSGEWFRPSAALLDHIDRLRLAT